MESQSEHQLNTKSKAALQHKRIYFISGLGADKRVFKRLKFEGYQAIHLNWLAPNKQEKLADYARRLAEEIDDLEPILIGLSFGGIVALEIAKQISAKQVILVSSAKHTQEVPWYFRLLSWFPLHILIPFKSLLWAVYWLINWLFSLETPAERKLLKAILKDTDAKFLRWAINQVVYWRNEIIPDNIYHIHGRSDRIFPITFVEPDEIIEKGGHLMIMNRADEISQIIDRLINKDKRKASVLD